MFIRRVLFSTLLLLTADSVASGSWVADNIGVTQSLRGVATVSLPLRPPQLPVSKPGQIVSIGWRYQLMSPPPQGLQVKLCTPSRCINLDGAVGQSRELAGESAVVQLNFVYCIAGKGRIYPPLQVISNQVLVNYR